MSVKISTARSECGSGIPARRLTSLNPPAKAGTQARRPRRCDPALHQHVGDPEQELLSDSITKDVITDLSKDCGSDGHRTRSSFTYKGRSVDIREVGEELRVHSVLEGSVRGQQSRADHRTADRRGQRRSSVDRPLRPRSDQHFEVQTT